MTKVDRKAATAACKERKSQAGVYAVRCSISGEVWVGESPNVDSRQTSLWFALRQQSCPRPDIVEAWRAHGEAAFSFEVVERIDPELSSMARGTALKEAGGAMARGTEGEAVVSVIPQISFDDFLKVDVRVGTVVKAEAFPEARKPAIKLTIDFGPEIGRKRSSAQIIANHPVETLEGRQVLAVVNFPPRQIGPFISEVLTLGVPDADGQVMLIGPERPVPDGGRLY